MLAPLAVLGPYSQVYPLAVELLCPVVDLLDLVQQLLVLLLEAAVVLQARIRVEQNFVSQGGDALDDVQYMLTGWELLR